MFRSLFVSLLAGLWLSVEEAHCQNFDKDVNTMTLCYKTSSGNSCFTTFIAKGSQPLRKPFIAARHLCNSTVPGSSLARINSLEGQRTAEIFIGSQESLANETIVIDAKKLEARNIVEWSWVNGHPTIPKGVSKETTLAGIDAACVESKHSHSLVYCASTQQSLYRYICEYTASRPAFSYQNKKRRYLASNGSATWFDARNECLRLGGDLASITDLKMIRNWLLQKETERYWIGLHRRKWIWNSTGAALTYTNWKGGYPDETSSVNKCICMDPQYCRAENNGTICDNDRKWKTCNCDQNYVIVCQKEDKSENVVTGETPQSTSRPTTRRKRPIRSARATTISTNTSIATTPITTNFFTATSIATTPITKSTNSTEISIATTPITTTTSTETSIATTPITTTTETETSISTTSITTTTETETAFATNPITTTTETETSIATTPITTTTETEISISTTSITNATETETAFATNPITTTTETETAFATNPITTTTETETSIATTPITTTTSIETSIATIPIISTTETETYIATSPITTIETETSIATTPMTTTTETETSIATTPSTATTETETSIATTSITTTTETETSIVTTSITTITETEISNATTPITTTTSTETSLATTPTTTATSTESSIATGLSTAVTSNETPSTGLVQSFGKNKILLIVLLLLAVIVIIVAVILFIGKRKRDKRIKTSPEGNTKQGETVSSVCATVTPGNTPPEAATPAANLTCAELDVTQQPAPSNDTIYATVQPTTEAIDMGENVAYADLDFSQPNGIAVEEPIYLEAMDVKPEAESGEDHEAECGEDVAANDLSPVYAEPMKLKKST